MLKADQDRKQAEEFKRQRQAAEAAEDRKSVEEEDEQTKRAAREAADRQRLAALKAEQDRKRAEAAKKADDDARSRATEGAIKRAQDAIVNKQNTEKTGDSAKLAALPKTEPNRVHPFDGSWVVNYVSAVGCDSPGNGSTTFRIENGVFVAYVKAASVSGIVTPSGTMRATIRSRGAAVARIRGTLRGNSGSGTASSPDGKCTGTFTATRN